MWAVQERRAGRAGQQAGFVSFGTYTCATEHCGKCMVVTDTVILKSLRLVQMHACFGFLTASKVQWWGV
jgi:hypothetical protein